MKKLLVPVILLVAGIGFIGLPSLFSSGSIDLKIEPAGFIMPAAYKVYANPDVANGRYHLFKAVIKNTGTSTLRNLKVQYKIPKYIDEWSDIPAAANLLPGQTTVVTCFPVFNQNITDKTTTSRETANIKITYGSTGSPTERDESFAFDMLSVNDVVFSDMNDKDKAFAVDYMENAVLYACYVTAEDPIIKYYAQQVQQKVLKGETAAGVGGNGQVGNKELEEAYRALAGVYNAMLLTKMVYSETSTNTTTYGENTSSSEHIRLPREVVTGNTGLCIELALLHCSVYKAMGLSPVLFLIPGHAYPGIKMGNNIIPIEATGVGGEGIGGRMSAIDALKAGDKEMNEALAAMQKGQPGYYMLDITQLYNDGYKDMELKDDQFLRTKIESLAQNFEPVNTNTNNYARTEEPQQREQKTRNTGNTTNTANAAAMLTYSGNISFNYPRNWSVKNYPLPQLPVLTTAIYSPNMADGIEIYSVAGAQNPAQAMSYIQQSLSRLGVNVSASYSGVQNGLYRYTGSSVSSAGSTNWVGYFKAVGGGVQAVVVGTRGRGSATLQQVLNSIN
jgi:hypothetical protein